MNEANTFWLVTGTFIGLAVASLCSFLIRIGRERLEGLEASSEPKSRGKAVITKVDEETKTIYLTAEPAPNDFAVTGKPLKPSWRLRKRELEAASRTKRKQLESFREIS